MTGRALLAWNLRRLRTAQGVSQEKLAADTGVDRAYLSELEREQGNATLDLLDRLANALDVQPADLLARPVAGDEAPRPLRPGRHAA